MSFIFQLAKIFFAIDEKTNLTFEIDSILNPYSGRHIRHDDLISGKLWVDKGSDNERELNFNVKEITNDCKVIAYIDEDDDDQNHDDDND